MCQRLPHSLRALLLLLTLAVVLTPARVGARQADETFPRVRAATPAARELLAVAVANSPRVAALVEAIQHTDLIVLLDVLPFSSGGPRRLNTGELHFLIATPAGRHVQILVSLEGSRRIAIGWLAHELFHAGELAQEPEVRTAAEVRRLFERIGDEWRTDQFETAAACAFQAAVLAELAQSNGRRRPGR